MGVDDLGLPADALGVPEVHPQQVAGEQRRLLAALARLDLEDDVLAVVRVARHEQPPQPLLELAAPRLQLGRPPRRTPASSAASSRAASRSSSAARSSRWSRRSAQLGVPLAERAGQGLVGVDGRVGEPLLELGVFADQIVEIRTSVSWPVRSRATAPAPTERSRRPARRATGRPFAPAGLLAGLAFLP